MPLQRLLRGDARLCTTRANGYRDNAIDLYAEQGGGVLAHVGSLPRGACDGVIDQRSACYVAGGDPRLLAHRGRRLR